MNEPNQKELERLVIGSLICNLGKGIDETMLISDDFSQVYGKMFDAIGKLHSRGVEADLSAVLAELGGPSCGMAGALSSAGNSVVSGANLGYYADKLKESVFEDRNGHAKVRASERIKAGEDPDIVLSDLTREISRLKSRFSGGAQDASLASACNDLLKIVEERKPISGIVKTGLRAIDELCGGLIPGDYVVLAARPSVGKTALALNIAAHCAGVESEKVCLISLEMKAKKLASRLLAMTSGRNTRMVLRNPADINDSDADAMIESSGKMLPIAEKIMVYDSTGPDVGPITQALKESVRSGAKLIILDYLQLMNHDGENRNQQVSAISRWFKDMVMSLNVPGIALCQLSRESEKEKRPPRMSDLRDSGSIEQDADIIWFLSRIGESDNIALIQAKGRDTGVGTRALRFRRESQTFHDLESRE